MGIDDLVVPREREQVNIAAMLNKAAIRFPKRPALALGIDTVADYRAFAGRAGALAGHLTGQFKLAPGERVCVTTLEAVTDGMRVRTSSTPVPAETQAEPPDATASAVEGDTGGAR